MEKLESTILGNVYTREHIMNSSKRLELLLSIKNTIVQGTRYISIIEHLLPIRKEYGGMRINQAKIGS